MKKSLTFNKNTEAILAFVVVVSFLLFFFENSSLTGFSVSGSTTSNVSIEKYLAISFGQNLSEGIQFGNVQSLPAVNINASHNYDGSANATTYTIVVSNDSNSPVDFCLKANSGLTSQALDVISLGNETYSDANSSSLAVPKLSNQTSMTTTYAKTDSRSIKPGSSDYWRFWLDVPSAQPSGNYNNTVSFKGVTSGVAC